jgi:hypothetical protein
MKNAYTNPEAGRAALFEVLFPFLAKKGDGIA